MMQSELKPCAHCGGEAELRGFQAPEFWVACHKVGCKAHTEGFGSKKRAIAAWNTRASDAEITRLTEALRAAEEREAVLVRLVERAQVNTPDQYVNWHEHARQALAGAKP